MPSKNEKVERAIVQITRAFSDVQCPCAITDARIQHEAEPFLSNRWTHWEAIPDDTIGASYWCLSFFNAEAFRFFLPAYMIWTLRNFLSPTGTADATEASLIPRKDESGTRLSEKSKHFDKYQIRAVLNFLFRCRALWKQLPSKTLARDKRRLADYNRGIEFWKVRLESFGKKVRPIRKPPQD